MKCEWDPCPHPVYRGMRSKSKMYLLCRVHFEEAFGSNPTEDDGTSELSLVSSDEIDMMVVQDD